MKFQITLKDTDSVYEAIEQAIDEELDKIEELDEDDKEKLKESRHEKISKICGQWFEYGEYLTVEIDTEANTCTVIPNE